MVMRVVKTRPLELMVLNQKQKQVLRLTTPKLHPGTEKRLGPLSLRMTALNEAGMCRVEG
jgi:hypothetical protein